MKNNYTEILKRIPNVKLSEFREGQIIKMCDGAHTDNPYYVFIIAYYPSAYKEGETKMITEIPGKRRVEMKIGRGWEYHWRRMEIIGMRNSENEHLLHNQSLT